MLEFLCNLSTFRAIYLPRELALVKAIERELSLETHKTDKPDPSPEYTTTHLEMMLEVSRIINSTLDLDLLLQAIIKAAARLTDTEAAAILLLEEQKGELYFQAVIGTGQDPLEPVRAPIAGTLAERIIKGGEPVVVHDLSEDTRHFYEVEFMPQLDVRAVLGVPLMVKNKVIGALEVLNKQAEVSFTGRDIQSLNILAMQAAIAIENVRLFQQGDQLVNVFHELSTPMRSIIGYSQLMLATPNIDGEALRTGLEQINQEATRLSHIVNDFLELAQLETGRVCMERETVNLLGLTQAVLDTFSSQAQAKKVSLSLTGDPAVPDIVADGNRLRQVVTNLIDNAIKYNRPGGQVNVTLTCSELRVQLSVKDTGEGIAAKDLELVFDKFYRGPAEPATGRGAGLGLALAKKIIEAHGGDIWVESRVGAGSTFTFSLPLQS